MRSVLSLLASGLILSLLFVASAYSQGTQTGGITGVVTDQGGAIVKGATVDVISEATGRSVRNVTVEDEGSFTASLLRPGTYRLEVTSANFKKAVVAGVQVRITETTRQDVSLEVGRIQETVNVEATPSLINPSSAQNRSGARLANSQHLAAGITQFPLPSFPVFRSFRRTDGRENCWTRNCGRERKRTAHQQ